MCAGSIVEIREESRVSNSKVSKVRSAEDWICRFRVAMLAEYRDFERRYCAAMLPV